MTTNHEKATPALSGVVETCLYVSDLDTAERFYGDVLGLEKEAREGDRHVFFRMERQMLLIFNPEESCIPAPSGKLPIPAHGARGSGHVGFAVATGSLDAWRAHLAAHDVAIEADVTWPNGAVSVYVRDPAGNSVEFVEPKLWGFDDA